MEKRIRISYILHQIGPSRLARFHGGPETDRDSIFDQEAEEYGNNVILKRELTTRYTKLGFKGSDLTRTVENEWQRLSSIRKQETQAMLPKEVDRIPVNTMEYEWKTDESGESRLWYPKTEEFVYQLYENTKEYAEKKNKKNLYNEEEYRAFLTIEKSLREGQASSALVGVHHPSQMTRYVQQIYTDGDKVKMSYIDVGLSRRDLFSDEAKSLLQNLAREKAGSFEHEGGFFFVLSKKGPISTDYIRESAAVKVLVFDSIPERRLNDSVVPNDHLRVYADEYKPGHREWQSAPPVQNPHRDVVVPTLIVGEWLSRQKKQIEEALEDSFVEKVMRALRPKEFTGEEASTVLLIQEGGQIVLRAVPASLESFHEQISIKINNRSQTGSETETVNIVFDDNVIEFLQESIPNEEEIIERQEFITDLLEMSNSTMREPSILPILTLQLIAEEQYLSQEVAIGLGELVIDNAPFIEARLEEAQKTLGLTEVIVEQPVLIGGFLWRLSEVAAPIVLTIESLEPELQEAENAEKNIGSLLRIITRLLAVNEKYSQESLHFSPKETPLPKVSRINTGGTEILLDETEDQKRSVLRLLVQFSLAVSILTLLQQLERLQTKETREKSETLWLLLSIIWYMSQIREQAWGSFIHGQPYKKKSRKRKKRTQRVFAEQGVVYAFTA